MSISIFIPRVYNENTSRVKHCTQELITLFNAFNLTGHQFMVKPSFRQYPGDITLREKIDSVGGTLAANKFSDADLSFLEWLGDKDSDCLLGERALKNLFKKDLSKYGLSSHLLNSSPDDIEALVFLAGLHPIDLKRFHEDWDDLTAV